MFISIEKLKQSIHATTNNIQLLIKGLLKYFQYFEHAPAGHTLLKQNNILRVLMKFFVHVNDYENIKDLIQKRSCVGMPDYT